MVFESASALKKARLHQVLSQVYRGRSGTRYELEAHLGMSQSAIVEYTRALIEEGIVEECGHDASSGGRPAVRLQLNPNYRHAIAVVVDVRTIRGAVLDTSGKVRVDAGLPLDEGVDRDALLGRVFEVIDQLVDRRDGSVPLLGVGVAVGGFVDSRQGVSREYLHARNWYDVPLADIVSQRYGVPCIVENKARALTLGEMYYGVGRTTDDMICLWLGQGIGMGLTIDGRLHEGVSGAAGEFGHNCVVPGGDACFCGKTGCLETVATERVLLAQVRERLSKGVMSELSRLHEGDTQHITMAEVIAASNRGDNVARGVFREAARYIGGELARICNILNPSTIVLEGSVTYGNRYLFEEIRRHVIELSLPQISFSIELQYYEDEENRRLEGLAARLILEHFDELAS